MDIGNDHVWRFLAFRKGLHGLASRHYSLVDGGRPVRPVIHIDDEDMFVTSERGYDRFDLRSRPNWDLP